MKKHKRDEIISLIHKIRDISDRTEEEDNELIEELESGVVDPYISDYIFWTEMAAEEIADKVLSYKPIIL